MSERQTALNLNLKIFMVSDENVIQEAKRLLKNKKGQVAINYLLKKIGVDDINRAYQIAAKMTENKKYVIFPSHTDEDVFVRKNPEYKNDVLIQLRNVMIAGLVSLLIGYIQYQYQHQSQNQQIQSIQLQLDSVKSILRNQNNR